MAAKKAKKKNNGSGKYSGPARRQLALVGLAGLFLVVWGFVLGILVGRGMVPTLVDPRPRPAQVTVTPDRGGDGDQSGKVVAARTDQSKTDPAGSDLAGAGQAKPVNQSNLEFFDQLAKKSPTTASRPETTMTTAKPTAKATTTTAPAAITTTTTTMAPAKAEPAPKKPGKKIDKPAGRTDRKTASTTKSKGDFTIQAAAFRSRSDATEYAAKISKRSGKNFVVVSGLSRGQLWHRVRLDARLNRLEAVALRKNLESKGFNPNVVRAK